MVAKLTLKLKKRTIEKGKKIAKRQKTSLSQMVENYLDKIADEKGKVEITPLVKSLSGVIKDDSSDYKKKYSEYLYKKYR